MDGQPLRTYFLFDGDSVSEVVIVYCYALIGLCSSRRARGTSEQSRPLPPIQTEAARPRCVRPSVGGGDFMPLWRKGGEGCLREKKSKEQKDHCSVFSTEE